MALPSELHQDIVGHLYYVILDYIRKNKGKCKPMIAPFDVVLNDKNVVQPDVMVICDTSKLDGKRCNGSPDWVIEVTSSNFRSDYADKQILYKEAGVREYWIVDTQKRKVVVLFFEKNPNTFSLYDFEQSVPVSIYDGKLEINIAELLEY